LIKTNVSGNTRGTVDITLPLSKMTYTGGGLIQLGMAGGEALAAARPMASREWHGEDSHWPHFGRGGGLIFFFF
jgi:hypothetical protein